MSKTQTFPKKSVFHSMLRSATMKGPLTVRFKTKPQKSKFKKPGEAGHWYIPFQVHGDPYPYTYSIENDTIKQLLDSIDVTTWCEIDADGMGDQASLAWLATSPAQNTQEDSYDPVPMNDPVIMTSPGYETVYDAAFEALFAAGETTKRFEEQFGRTPTEHEYRFATSLMIRAENTGQQIMPDAALMDTTTVPETPETIDATRDSKLAELIALAEQIGGPDERENIEEWASNNPSPTEVEAMMAGLKMLARMAAGPKTNKTTNTVPA